MASKTKTCAGCLKIIGSNNFLKCSNCNSFYDSTCANFTEKRFVSFFSASTTKGKENRRNWACPGCMSKKPKGDNSNTPLRSHNDGPDSPQPASGDSRCSSPSDNNLAANTENFTLSGSEMKSLLRSELAPIKQQLYEMQESVKYVSAQYDDLIKINNSIKADYEAMKAENTALRSTVVTLNERMNNLEQHLRDCNLEIQGVPQHKNENVVEIVKKIGDIVSLKIEDRDILNCTRVASMNKDSQRPRAIIVKLNSTRRRDEVYSAVARFNKAHPNNKLSTSHLGTGGNNSLIYVSEHLSPANKALHYAARTKASQLGFKFVWVRNGRIFLRKDETSRFIHVKNLEALSGLE